MVMEESLDLSIKELLPLMQERILRFTKYFGVHALKSPLDFWIYQEIIFESKPDIIIEIGNFHGGSLLAMAHLCDLLGHGQVIGIDISHEYIPPIVRQHPRVTLIEGDAIPMLPTVMTYIQPEHRVLVIEDSSHTYDNTLAILNSYSPFIKPGDYFIVEDGICHHGLEVGPNPGPYEAIETFLRSNALFESDRSREAFLLTWNPKGFLKRKAAL